MSLSSEDVQLVDDYFAAWRAWVSAAAAVGGLRSAEWRRRLPIPPVRALQSAALEHPNPRVRRECLGVLDHSANDDSSEVFRAALTDPVPRVRVIALHGLACERCRTRPFCVADVVPTLVTTLQSDPSPRVRHDAVVVLAGLASRDARAATAIARAAESDDDGLVRQVAHAAVDSRSRDVRSRKAVRRRARVRE